MRGSILDGPGTPAAARDGAADSGARPSRLGRAAG